MLPEFALGKLTSSWMLIVVVLNLRVAIKTEGNAVFKAVVTAKVLWFEVVRLNSDPTEFVANAA